MRKYFNYVKLIFWKYKYKYMNSFNSLSGKINNTSFTKPIYNIDQGVLNNISATSKNAMLKTGTTLQSGAYGLLKLNTLYTGATIKINGTDFYAQSTTTYGTLQTLGNVPLITFLNGQPAYVTIWYDQTGNGNNATGVNNPTYNTSTNNIDFGATGYFTLPNSAYPSGNSAYSFIFTPLNQPANTNQVIYTGGDYSEGKYLQAMIYYNVDVYFSYFNVWYAFNVWTKSSVSNGVIVEDTPAVLNGVNISDTYNGNNANTRSVYFNGSLVTLSSSDPSKIRNSLTTNNFLGNKNINQTDTAKFTGSLKYFIWAPISLSLPDINILHKVATNIVS